MQEENLFTPDCIRTYSGQYVNVLNPDPETLNVEDIAHGLAGALRFGAQSPIRYTVAQHSVMCARGTEGDKFEALMHDATEAYLGDMASPIKRHLPDYKALEERFSIAIANKFGFNYPYHPLTKAIDLDMLHWEWDTIMLTSQPLTVEVWGAERAKEEFLTLYNELKRN